MTTTPTLLEVEEVGSPSVDGGPPTSTRRILTRLGRDKAALFCVAFLLLVVLMAVFAPLITKISGWGPYEFDSAAINSDLGGVPHGALGGISGRHWFGVEPQNGRDLFARIVYGARVSITIALSATVLTGVLGVVFGMLAGFYRGWVDQVISRLMDFLMAFPALIFMIAILSSLPAGNRPVLLVVVISAFGWPYLARVIRGQTMTLANREFVEAARASGAKNTAVVFREILPNLRGSIIVMTTLALPGYIGTEAGLSFLGVGVSPPTASWGQMISGSVSWYSVDPMFFAIPGAFLFLTVLSLTVLGDKIRSVIDAGEAS
ncbi:peptide/nickel transport system permease protein [Kribbella voronezhensis]|uniref:Peptide/nickel transport system permease protein n=1 Tax=Kribbella voronezhensis TaxID=2512212 RepID=A0A4R7T5W5_9ACTN|nr:ABC transporter permease [Kribbella voronezhensis]TDU87232.1 peptide/nickel transport system permease protein [Kribbella voronezhensis]